MNRLLILIALFLASASSAAPSLDRVAEIAAEIGTPAPASALSAPAPAAPSASAPRAAALPVIATKAITIRVLLTGGDKLACEHGRFGGHVRLHGAARVYVEDGYDDVPVNVAVDLTGACVNGSGTVTGAAVVAAEDGVYLYKNGSGRQIGFLSVSGPLSLSQEATGGWISIGQFVDLAGTLETPCVARWQCGIIPDPDSR